MRFQPSGVGIWSRYGKKSKIAAKIRLTKCYLITSSTWLINMYVHFHIKSRFQILSTKKESDFKLHLQTSRRPFGESFFHKILEL